MSTTSGLAGQRKAEEIPFDRWIPFLTEFTRENRGAHARLEIIGSDTEIGDQVETEDRPFDGASADIKDNENTIWIAFGSTTDNHMSHSVPNARVLRSLPATETTGPGLEIEAADGTKNLLQLSKADAYSLSPAGDSGSSR